MKLAPRVRMAELLAVIILMIPWVNPFAPGPSPAFVPWLVALTATTTLAFLHVTQLLYAQESTVNDRVFLWFRLMAWAWLGAGILSSCMAQLQYFGAASVFAPWVNTTEPGYAFANLRQRNQFASLTNMGQTVLLARAMGSGTTSFTRTVGLRMVGCASVLALGNAASASRTGLVQIILLGLLFMVWGGWRRPAVRQILLTIILTYTAAAIALPMLAGLDLSIHGMAARLSSGDAPCASRLTLWSNVLHLISQKPLLGWGWGELDYAHFITLYNAPRFCDILDNAHNLPLHLAVELGIPLALLICGGFAWWIWRQKPWAERDTTRQMAWAVMAVILLHSMLEYPLWYGPFQMAFGACVLLLWRQKSPQEVQNRLEKVSNRHLTPILYAPIATISIAFIVYAMWDYQRVSQIYLPPEARDSYYRSDTLAKIRSSWLFADQVRFAELMTTALSPANAAWTFSTAKALLHYSPEPRVIEKLIESAAMLGRNDEALAYLARYRIAFPKEHALWAKANEISVAKPN